MKKWTIVSAILGGIISINAFALEQKEGDTDDRAKFAIQQTLAELFSVIKAESPEQIKERVEHLLSIGGDVNAYDETAPFDENATLSRPPLLFLVADQSLEKCMILIKAKADPNVSALGGLTPLHATATAIRDLPHGPEQKNKADELEKIFKFLICEGADPYNMGHESHLDPRCFGWTAMADIARHPKLVAYAKNVSNAVRRTKAAEAERQRLKKKVALPPAREVAADSSGMPLVLPAPQREKNNCFLQ